MHFHETAYNAALVGRKRWFFRPPSHVFWSRKPVLRWFQEEYSKLKQPLFECVQEPGDIIYVPEGYGHAVLNLEESLAVAMEIQQKLPDGMGYV